MAEETVATVETEALPSLEKMSEPDRAAFLKEGTLPTKSSDGGGQKPTAESGAASEAAQTEEPASEEQPKPRETRSERRIRQLSDKVKQLESQLNARSNGNERPPVQEQLNQSSKAPKLKSFTSQIGTKYGDWEAAHEAYEDAVDAFHVEQRRAAVAEALKVERENLEQAKAQETAKKTVETIASEFAKRSEKFRKTLPQDTFVENFTEVHSAVTEAIAERPEFNQVADALTDSEVGPEMIHYLGQHLDELDALLDMPIGRALREIGKLEVSDKIKTPTPKTATAAKGIGRGVSGAGASSHDPIEQAIEKNDVLGYIKAMNAKEAAERKR